MRCVPLRNRSFPSGIGDAAQNAANNAAVSAAAGMAANAILPGSGAVVGPGIDAALTAFSHSGAETLPQDTVSGHQSIMTQLILSRQYNAAFAETARWFATGAGTAADKKAFANRYQPGGLLDKWTARYGPGVDGGPPGSTSGGVLAAGFGSTEILLLVAGVAAFGVYNLVSAKRRRRAR